jgi:hypothetical protein
VIEFPLRCRPVTSSTSSPAAAVPYFATEAHYLSLAGRLAAALQDRRLVLVTGDPPADPQLLSEALRKVTQARHMVIDIPCSGELEIEQLSRACCVGAAEPAPALFVFDEVDRLSDLEVAQACKAIAQKAGESAAAVLLARGCFSDRLEAPLLQPVKEAVGARFRLDEIGEDESIDFLRHQLQTRHRDDEKRGVPPVVFGASAVLGVVATLGVCALLVVRHIDTPRPTTPTVAATSPPPAAQPPPDAPAQPVAPAAPPVPQSPAIAPLSSTETAMLLSRGDDFLKAGDIASARLYYERAADAGNGSAALRLGATFDPGFLASAGVRGTLGDPARAASWYTRARELGEAVAAQRLKRLDHTTP